ncbi:TVG1388786 [Thermoplasma volcanium GSS1]|uniref:TVG1388786 protein n=1 Tax=Thermoplasma volcanium (strain ATCC 51530 / DSM 4299 / JCM 9571 / NBRC 15438 / GSS1) TaxID=273116 RepID=Q978S1_THEVO|nr:TVG1388786 [Thermoplasma volcanium GSS1]
MNKSIVAIALISLVALSSLAGISLAKPIQTGVVNVKVTSPLGPADVPVKILNSNGVLVAKGMGPSFTANLTFGKYYVYIPNYYGTGPINNTIYYSKTIPFNLTSSSYDISVNVNAVQTYGISVNVKGITKPAMLMFKTADNFVFNETQVNAGTYIFQLPINTPIYAILNYSSKITTYLMSINSSSSTFNITPNTPNYYGFTNVPNGNIVLINDVSPYNYTVIPFSGYSFSVYSNTPNTIVVVEAPGYSPQVFKSSENGNTVALQPSTSNVYYNYSISSNLKQLYLNITYNLNNATTFPAFFGNSSVGSLYWQMKLDHITTSEMVKYFYGLAQNYTQKSFMVNGVYYNLTAVPKVSVISTSNTSHATINAVYANVSPVSSLNTINVYVYGTQYLPGALNYYYNISYHNTSLAVSSSNVPLSSSYMFVKIKPQPSNVWATLKFSPVVSPVMTNSSYTLYWKDMVSNNYVLNSTSTNSVYVVPRNQTVYLNSSTAYFNPVTNSDDYMQANFTWTIGSSVFYGYNISNVFRSSSTSVSVFVRSPSGGTAYSNFTVLSLNNTTAPKVKFSASYNGHSISYTSKLYSTNETMLVSLSVPQSAQISYSLYGSSLVLSGYNVYLGYNWKFPTATYIGDNVSYAFSHPSIAPGYGNQVSFANITTEAGNVYHILMKVYVNDTTPPSATFFMKYNNTYITNPVAGKVITLSANNTTDPYYPFSSLKFQWIIEYINGTPAAPSDTTYTNLTPMNESYLQIVFNTVASMKISLQVTNPSNVSGYANKTVSMVVVTPRLVVNSIYASGAQYQGSSSKLYVNVSNLGTENAYNVLIQVYVNGKVYGSTTVSEIKAGASDNVSINWVPPTSGKVSVYATASVNSEPRSFVTAGALTQTVSVNPPAYRTPLIVVSVIVVLVIVIYVYYKLRSGTPKQQKGPQPKTELPKKQEKKK